MTNMWPPKSPYPHEQATETALRMLSDEQPLSFDEFYKKHTSLGEQEWKHAWKLNYMKRLDIVAETAWQNNMERMATEGELDLEPEEAKLVMFRLL